MSYVKICAQCAKKPEDDLHNGYYPFIRDDIYICPICHYDLIDTILTKDEYLTIEKISNKPSFIEAMIKLKQDDIIEFQLKIKQFELQKEQEKQLQQIGEESNKPHCPTCGSTNIKQITGTERAMSIIGLGIFSKKINKTYECLNCKCTW